MMDSSVETSAEIRTCQRRRPRMQLNHLLFTTSILQVKKDNNKRKVTVKDRTLLNESNGENSEPQPSVRSQLERKTVTDEAKTVSSPNISQNSRILNDKSCEKSSYDPRKHCSYMKKEFNPRSTNKSCYATDNVEKKHFSSYIKSSDIINSQNEKFENCIEFKEIKNSHKILPAADENFKVTFRIALKNNVPRSTPIATTSDSLLVSNTIYNLRSDQNCSDSDKEPILTSTEGFFIPAPVMCEFAKDSLGTCSNKASSNTVSELQPSVRSQLERKTVTDEAKTVSSPNISQNSRILNDKSCEKSSYDPRKHCSYIKKKFNPRSKNKSYATDNVEKKHVSSYIKSSDIINSQNEKFENCIEFKEIKNSRKILPAADENFKVIFRIALKNDVPRSTPIATTSDSLLVSNTIYNLRSDQNCSDSDKEPILTSTVGNFIPAPVMCEFAKDSLGTCSTEASSNTVSEKNKAFALYNDSLESAEGLSDSGDETSLSLPDSEQVEAITKFILTVVKEKSVSNALADQVERDINAVLKDHLEGQRVDQYGSYSSDLAICTSDINLALISDCSVRKSFIYEVFKLLSNELKQYFMCPFEEGISSHRTKINFFHRDTGITCQLAYLGRNKTDICKMGRFLRKVSICDERVKSLIVATKVWSECLCINEVEEGKLHPIGYVLMVLHFLQHCERPILPIFHSEKTMNSFEIESLPRNNSSIGELWLAFLKYYAVRFNWKRDVISVNSEKYVSKQSKGWETYWIAVEDPFTEKNIAASVVNSHVASYIKACFKSSYEYFCNPPDHAMLYSANEEDEKNGHSLSSKWQFSFQQCIADQCDAFCEECEEQMDICDECEKKLYVQPMLSVPKMTDSFLKLVKESLITIYNKYILSDNEMNERKMFVEKLQASIRRIHPDADLNLFGSSANGFGFKNSDLDICITFKSNKVINTASVLKDVRYLLRMDRNFDHVVAIFNASIPIVKFHYQPKGWRGDISLQNILAIHNSDLLHTYSLLDERCKILGCALKLLAKKALIAEVTDGALSSYSYLNMVIHFLQQREPPVLPVLQDFKFRNNDFRIEHIVENCNVWFCKDLDYIQGIFVAENKTPVEQLWLDLLDFYCSYDSNRFISIRQKDPVYKSENICSARLFNIQDPFIETKNLGRVVSAKKAQETESVLLRARQLFRTPVKELPSYVKDIEDFFFSTQSLTGKIHKEVHCDLCGKFGHEKNECKQSSFPLRRFRLRPYA